MKNNAVLHDFMMFIMFMISSWIAAIFMFYFSARSSYKLMVYKFLNFYNRKEGFLNLQTSKYKLHFYETPSGLKFIMNTDLGVGNCRDELHQIYNNVSTLNV